VPGQGVQNTLQVLPRLLYKALNAPYQPGLGREVNCLGKVSMGIVQVMPVLIKVFSAPYSYHPGLGRWVNCLGMRSRILCMSCLDCSPY
jgi:hypothetical protein